MPRSPIPRRTFFAQATGTGMALAGLPASNSAEETEAKAPEAGSDKELPATDLADLKRAVDGVLSTKRLGQPVFARLTLHLPARPKEVRLWLARMTELVRGWMDQPLAGIQAVGSLRSGQVCLTLQFSRGASALITFARGRAQGDGLDLFLLGNHGALYRDLGTGPLWDTTVQPARGAPDPKLLALIDRALSGPAPVNVDQEGGSC